MLYLTLIKFSNKNSFNIFFFSKYGYFNLNVNPQNFKYTVISANIKVYHRLFYFIKKDYLLAICVPVNFPPVAPLRLKPA